MPSLPPLRALSAFALSLLVLAPPARADKPLAEGDAAPAFSAQGDDGKTYSLDALRGKTVVLYFYPKDETPGCTVEAEEFRDAFEKFQQKGAVVLGVSLDDAGSHRAFRDKHQLNFPLLVKGEPIARAYGVPVHLGFASRQTFVIDKQGKVKRVFRDVKPRGHSAEILSTL